MGALRRLAIACLSGASLLAAASPLVVLREAAEHEPSAIVQAAAEAPDEAVAIMSRGSRAIEQAIESSGNAPLRVLPALAHDRCVPESVCSSAGVFYRQIAAGTMTSEQAKRIASNRADYFHHL
ncbi:MAG: hypothetical protein ABI972_13225, partial [Acidobacteriota bacterium]